MFKATRKHDNHSVAIKKSFNFFDGFSENEKKILKEEITNMTAFPHPFIAKLIDDYIDSAGYLCLVLNRYHDGDFKKYLEDRQ